MQPQYAALSVSVPESKDLQSQGGMKSLGWVLDLISIPEDTLAASEQILLKACS